MTTAAAIPSTLTLTDEQQQFVEAIRDFSAREAGTREQRDALTHEGTEQHNPELYKRFAALGYVGAAIPEAYGGSGGGARRPLPAARRVDAAACCRSPG